MAGFISQFSSGAGEWNAGPNGREGRVVLYDVDGNPLTVADKSAIGANRRGLGIVMGSDYKVSRLVRVSSTGALAEPSCRLLLSDEIGGAAVNTRKWVQTVTTMTITQGATPGTILFNANSTTTGATGAMHVSHRAFPMPNRSRLVRRLRVRHTAHFTNNLIEHGFGVPASATAATIANGAVWRKDGTGQYVPVLSINGAETLGTAISNATWTASAPATDYFDLEIEVENARAHFRAWTAAGAVISEQTVDFTGTTSPFSATHLQALDRTYQATGTGTAVQILLGPNSVWFSDVGGSESPWEHSRAGQEMGALTSPTAYTQLANYTNNTAATARALSNTAAAETTLGGYVKANSIAGAETDLILFGWTNPTPYTFMFRGITIPKPLNQVVAVATTEFLISYSLAFNSSAVSLATAGTYPPMKIALPGYHNALVALAANKQFTLGEDIQYYPQTPIPVFPGRFFHVCCRVHVGTATATETILWNIAVDGFFE